MVQPVDVAGRRRADFESHRQDPPAAHGTDHSWNFAAVEIIPMQRVPPPITWPTPADIVYGTPLDDAQLNATTEVAGTFVYTPPAGTVLNAGSNQMLSVTFTPANSTTIYGPATATVPLTVLKAPSFVTWSGPAGIASGTALTAAQLNATANLPGTFVYSPVAGTILSAGSNQPLSVTFTPDDSNHQTVVTTVFVNVTATTPAVIWNVPAPIVYGAALGAGQLNASAGVPGTFAYTPAAGTILPARARTLSVTFTPTDVAYAPSSKTVPLTVLKASPVITWTTPANIVSGIALSGTQLNAVVAAPAGTLAYSPAAGTVLLAGPSQRLTVTFTPTDTANYNVVSAAGADHRGQRRGRRDAGEDRHHDRRVRSATRPGTQASRTWCLRRTATCGGSSRCRRIMTRSVIARS